ncbi:MAG: hypothetical protein CM1200mP11_3010 [Nitrosopumilaceae archaeon]|nr:MAG: hypothetical protein CM1200mP11_3010 [Nitrosopumilaceae archaeon]
MMHRRYSNKIKLLEVFNAVRSEIPVLVVLIGLSGFFSGLEVALLEQECPKLNKW